MIPIKPISLPVLSEPYISDNMLIEKIFNRDTIPRLKNILIISIIYFLLESRPAKTELDSIKPETTELAPITEFSPTCEPGRNAAP